MNKRVVVIGAKGFIGSSIVEQLKKESFDPIQLTSSTCDLLINDSISILKKLIKNEDIIVFAAAIAPVKNWEMFGTNMIIVQNLLKGLEGKKIQYLLNISSDAVYSDSTKELNEKSATIPDNPHGYMHFVRETLLNENFNYKIGHLRPTLVYGENDPHNGYGPNMFLRLAKNGENISLFGKGEELRDHIYVGDVAKIASYMISNSLDEVINAVSSSPLTFMQIAEEIKRSSKLPLDIISKKRNGPMPHNGLRIFSKSKITNSLFEYKFKSLKDYIKKELNG